MPALLKVVMTVVFAAASIGLASPAVAKTCDGKKVPCKIGDTGPGGGIVFYDAGSRQPWGRYLEAPGKVKGKQRGGLGASWENAEWSWCLAGQPGYAAALPTGSDIGMGRENTRIIIEACGDDTAAGIAAAYRGGGKDDWFLPSTKELWALYWQRNVVGGLGTAGYWTSSQAVGLYREVSAIGISFVWGQEKNDYRKEWDLRVRPVRAF